MTSALASGAVRPDTDAIAVAHAAVARLKAEQQEISAALDRGRRQRSSIDQKLRALATDGPDGEQAAAALLAGSPVTADAADVNRFETEREAVQSGLNALTRRQDENSRELGQAEAELRTALAGSVEAIVSEVRERTRRALQDLAQAYADAEAIRSATGNLQALEVTMHVRGLLFRAAVEKLVGRSQLLPSADIIHALPTPELVRAAGGHLPAAIAWPDHP